VLVRIRALDGTAETGDVNVHDHIQHLRAPGLIPQDQAARAGSSAFNDITPSGRSLAVVRHRLKPNGKTATMLRSLDRDTSLATAVGWDDVTGLGSPRAVQLLSALR